VGFSRATALNALTLAAILATASIPLMGMAADRWGARRVFMAGTVALMLFAFPYFWLISRGSTLWLTVATAVAMAVCWAPITAALGTLYAGMFSTEVRYTGAAMGHQLGGAITGFTPLIAGALSAATGDAWWPVAIYVVVACLISAACVYASKETRARRLSGADAARDRGAPRTGTPVRPREMVGS